MSSNPRVSWIYICHVNDFGYKMVYPAKPQARLLELKDTQIVKKI